MRPSFRINGDSISNPVYEPNDSVETTSIYNIRQHNMVPKNMMNQ